MVREHELGRSVEGRAIMAIEIGDRRGPTKLILGGFHGDEPNSVTVARRFAAWIGEGVVEDLDARYVIVPVVNPDAYERRTRRNANKIDLNRNFPTRNWRTTSPRTRMYGGERPASEPETQAVIRAVQRFKPSVIITIHSISGGRHCNNYDGPAAAIARRMRRRNGYPVRRSIGYPTPGSFGTWVGIERRIATITLELPTSHSTRRCWEENRWALLEA